MKSIADGVLRLLLTAVHSLLKAGWFVRRPATQGAHAIALTPDNRIVLVKLRYAPGWRLPGGGRSENESAAQAALRELREEIGLTSHGDARPVADIDETVDFKRDSNSLILVRDVQYVPRWSWEVEQVCEARLDALPPDLAPSSARWIESARPLL